ncbi:MAG: aminopeptidase P family protein [Candidatus Cellulosilyticum pullistercoris]|uniref:Aminopeptidase P family protein n=1 Tax=Candidatus Cellulosilyticum pullistercoris TaxID=2838521 RepID=A0A9E2KBZ4_9FIRM|nr:aminopeptidase P family protein [Candidatus Cellulosilyticum pullistercoris]
MNTRIEKLREYMKTNGLNGFLIGSEANRMYLSGFTGSNAMLLITNSEQYIITDFRYLEQVAKECPDFICIDQGKIGLLRTAFDFACQASCKKIAFEAEHISYSRYQELVKESRIEWIPTEGVVERLREIKEETELEKLAKAESIGDIAFKEVIKFIEENWKKGITENEVALEIERVMRKNGASGNSFDTIVASGAKSSLPHAKPGDEFLKKGDFVVMDFGCIYEGYCSDMTRTIVIGEASPKHREIYDTVLKAQELALQGIRAGLKGKEVDAIARHYITEAGYGNYFGHGLGHSVGIEIHENPRFSMAEEQIIESGMVITVEPGIYLPGFGGVRIEDMVIVTKEGIKNLTHSPKELIIIN